jgi:NADP-dependent 3-hydroxy acid dehydrogenase YdfG
VVAISDALRREAIPFGIRVTTIEPGAVATELVESIRHEETKQAVISSFYGSEAKILRDDDIAHAILYAVSQPSRVNVSELLIRPITQEF